MILEIALMLVAGAATFGGDRGIKKILKKFSKKKERTYPMGVLPDHAWQNLQKHIVNECQGWAYADALLQSIVEAGYYFSAIQVYELRAIYKKKGWHSKNYIAHIDKITDYWKTCKFDARDKVFDFLTEPIDNLYLEKKRLTSASPPDIISSGVKNGD